MAQNQRTHDNAQANGNATQVNGDVQYGVRDMLHPEYHFHMGCRGSCDRSRSSSVDDRSRISMQKDLEGQPGHAPAAAPEPAQAREQGHAQPISAPPRSSTISNIKRHRRSFTLILGLLLIGIILAIVLPLCRTLDARLKRDLAEATAAAVAEKSWASPTSTIIPLPSSTLPPEASRYPAFS